MPDISETYRTSLSVTIPTVCHPAVLIGKPFRTLTSYPAGRAGNATEALVSSSITRTLSAGVTPRLCAWTYARVTMLAEACVATF